MFYDSYEENFACKIYPSEDQFIMVIPSYANNKGTNKNKKSCKTN